MADGEIRFQPTCLTMKELEEQRYSDDLNNKVRRLYRNLQRVQDWFRNRFKYLNCGRHKTCYEHPTGPLVIKVPKSAYGVLGIESEYGIFLNEKDKPNRRVADCVLRRVGGVPILIAERVEVFADAGGPRMSDERRAFAYGKGATWIDMVDCGQVGQTWDGRIVAFDYGYNEWSYVNNCPFIVND